MSPRHFTKAIYGPYYLSAKHFDLPQKPKTRFEKFSYWVIKYSGIGKIINFIKSPNKITPEFEHLPYQTRPEVPEAEIDLRALREQRRAAKQSNQ
jgi:hypothetical protein